MKKKVLIGISLAVMGAVTIFGSNAKAELSLADENIQAIKLTSISCEAYCEKSKGWKCIVTNHTTGEVKEFIGWAKKEETKEETLISIF